MKKILLIEDEESISSLVKRGLEESGYTVHTAADGILGWQAVMNENYNLIILDIIMPGIDGLEFCRRFRRQFGTSTPILMLTALVMAEDVANGLQAGADDYLRKPFKWVELEARVTNLLRRPSVAPPPTLHVADLSVDTTHRTIVRAGRPIFLSNTEYALLLSLLHHQGQPVSRSTLLHEVWNRDFDSDSNLVEVYINYLRNKIDRGHSLRLIRTIPGKGYTIDSND